MSNALQDTANRLIATYGAEVTVTRIVEGAYDEVTGSAALTTTATTARALLDNYSLGIGGGLSFAGTVESSDKRLWIAGTGLSFDPRPGDKVLADGASWVVISVNKINPDGNTYLYDIQVRQ